jgi:hypothetical protein
LEADVCRAAAVAPTEVRRLAWSRTALRAAMPATRGDRRHAGTAA